MRIKLDGDLRPDAHVADSFARLRCAPSSALAELADDLRRRGHLVDTVGDEGLQGKADPLVADAARRSRRCLFTLDKGLGDVRRYPPKVYHGIVVFRLGRVGRIAVRRSVLELLPEIERQQPLRGLLLVAGDSGIRIRR